MESNQDLARDLADFENVQMQLEHAERAQTFDALLERCPPCELPGLHERFMRWLKIRELQICLHRLQREHRRGKK